MAEERRSLHSTAVYKYLLSPQFKYHISTNSSTAFSIVSHSKVKTTGPPPAALKHFIAEDQSQHAAPSSPFTPIPRHTCSSRALQARVPGYTEASKSGIPLHRNSQHRQATLQGSDPDSHWRRRSRCVLPLSSPTSLPIFSRLHHITLLFPAYIPKPSFLLQSRSQPSPSRPIYPFPNPIHTPLYPC